MARAAVLGRLTWRVATLRALRRETATAATLAFDVPGWPGHAPGQHVDVRLTAADGYTATRPYSVASAPSPGSLELTVETVPGGEVSPFLVDGAEPGLQVEVRGPLGGWFVWRPEQRDPVLLVGGGSGVVPLVSILRTHRAERHDAELRLLYSVRTPASVLYASELASRGPAEQVHLLHTREAPVGARPPHRLDVVDLERHGLAPEQHPAVYVCGPTGFVESVIALLVRQGHDPRQIRAERFGAARSSS